MRLAMFVKALEALGVQVVGSNEHKDPEWMLGAVHGLEGKNLDLVDGEGGLWITANGEPWMPAVRHEAPLTVREQRLLDALQAMVVPFVEGTHYDTRNPYARPYVKQALVAIGEAKGFRGDWLDTPLDGRTVEA